MSNDTLMDELERDEEQDGSEELVQVILDIQVGDQFSSFKEFKEKLDATARQNFVKFSKRDSRTLEAARRKIKRPLKPELEYYHLRYACFYSQKNKPRGTGKRNRKSLAREYEVSCPASISVKATENGEFLEVYNIMEIHNHPVNEVNFQKLLPKKRNMLEALLDSADKLGEEDELDSEDKYKIVLNKCKPIARIASFSSISRIQEIVKNLDDYIYYLKYTASKDDDDVDQLEAEQENHDLCSNDAMTGTADDESIHIIVESDNAMDS